MLDFEIIQAAEKPQKLLIFLHGYNGNLEDYHTTFGWLRECFDNSVIIAPAAPEICDKNPQKKQWFGMQKHDPKNKRYQLQTSVEDIIRIYNQTAEDIKNCADNLNLFINEQQKIYDLTDSQTYILGFSQGAMLAIFSALSRNQKIGGAFSLSGLIAGAEILEENLHSKPYVCLLHGKNDATVQFKTTDFSLNWLKSHGINASLRTYDSLFHSIIKQEIIDVADIIAYNDKHKL